MKTLSLLDTLSIQIGCTYLSDLHFLDTLQHRQLAEVLEHIAAGDFELREWNDALNYLTGSSQPKTDAEQSKAALIAWLSTN